MIENIREKLRRVAQDKDVDDKKGTQPKKYYSGVDKDKKSARDAHFKKGAEMDDDNPNAYKPAPGDKDPKTGELKKTKPSKHTQKFKKMFGENYDGDMAQNSLENIVRNANNLKRVVKEDGDYPAWWNSKLTKADDYLDVCHDYLMSELSQSEQIDEELKSSDRSYLEKRVKMLDQLQDKIIRMKIDDRDLKQKANKQVGLAKYALDDLLDADEMSEDLEENAPNTADAMKRYKAGKAGFTDKAHLKAKGLIPRADGTKKKSPKYEDLEEGKLVASMSVILKTMTQKWMRKAEIEYKKNPEKGLSYIRRLGSIIGAKVTDKEQQKNHLFLKMGDEITEAKKTDMTAISSWKKKLKNVKGISKDTLQQLSMLPTPVITSLINQIGMIVSGDELEEKRLADILRDKEKSKQKAHQKAMMKTARDSIKKYKKSRKEELGKNADAGDYIDDFRKSDAPQFKGKSDKKIRDMAIAAYLSKKDKK